MMRPHVLSGPRHRLPTSNSRPRATLSRRNIRLFWWLLACSACLIACDGTGSKSTFVEHLTPSAQGDAFDPTLITEEVEAFEWNDVPWTLESGASSSKTGPDGIWLRGLETPTTLSREVEISASDVHAFEVELQGFTRGGLLKLCWTTDEQKPSNERCVSDRPKTSTARFEVAPNAEWAGRVDRLILHLFPRKTGGNCRVGETRGLKWMAEDQKLAQALARSWRVTLESDFYRDTRIVQLSAPGVPIARTLDVPKNARLQFSAALPPGVIQPVDFRVVAETGADSDVLWTSTLNSEMGWQDVDLDLGSYGGRTIELKFDTETEDLLDLARGLPLWAEPRLVAPRPDKARPKVILISIDTLRADHLSLYGYERQTSPRLDQWAQCATTFETAVSAAPWTIPSHTSMFTGLDPFQHSINQVREVPESLEMLAEVLRDAGYSTAAVTGGGYLSEAYGLDQGFDRYLAWSTPGETGKLETEKGVDSALHWIEQNQDAPYFLFLHTYGTHTPYRQREPYLSEFLGAEQETDVQPIGTRLAKLSQGNGYQLKLEWIWVDDVRSKREGTALEPSEGHWPRDLYDSNIAHVDSEIGRFFEALEDMGELDETIVIVTSDHGESLGEHGAIGHTYLYDVVLKVPLVIRRPGCEGIKTVDTQVRSIDIAPTVVDLLDLSFEHQPGGRSLRPLMDSGIPDGPRIAWSYAGWANYGVSVRVRNQMKYIFNNAGWDVLHGQEEFYRLDEDPEELNDVAMGDPSISSLRDQVFQRLATDYDGVRLSFWNRSDQKIEGGFRASDWGSRPASRIKSWNMPPEKELTLAGGVLGFSVAPGESYDLVLELPRQDVVTLKATGTGQPVLKLDLSTASGSREVGYADDGWSLDATEAERGVTVSWSFKAASAGKDAKVDPEIVEQLRALGYVGP